VDEFDVYVAVANFRQHRCDGDGFARFAGFVNDAWLAVLAAIEHAVEGGYHATAFD
jgi:hypothetical protein